MPERRVSYNQLISIHSLIKIIPTNTSVFLLLCDDNNKISISLRKSREKNIFKISKLILWGFMMCALQAEGL